jgi:hypothetical protein
LLIGSLLPDVIDKPLGHLFFPEVLGNGRVFAHTLVFLALITILGLVVYRPAGKTRFLVLSFGTAAHLVLDQMWRNPRTLLWPAYGFAFERTDVTDWIPDILHALTTNPGVYVPELVGAAILVWLA